MERSLTMELVRVTEGAAQESARWLGRGKKKKLMMRQQQRCAMFLTQYQCKEQ